MNPNVIVVAKVFVRTVACEKNVVDLKLNLRKQITAFIKNTTTVCRRN